MYKQEINPDKTTMKKLLFLLMMFLTVSTTMQAQDIYNFIRENAQKSVNDPKTEPMLRNMNQFKLDALNYMAMKMKQEMPDSTVTFLDNQAYALNNFMNLYMRTVIDNMKQPKAYQVKFIKLFMDASYSNPLFNDEDKELVLSYFSDGSNMTRFSLDTDWRRAYIAAHMELKKMK